MADRTRNPIPERQPNTPVGRDTHEDFLARNDMADFGPAFREGLGAGTTASAAASSLIGALRNGSFKDGISGWSVAGTATLSWDTSTYRTLNGALRFSSTSAGAATATADDYIPVVGGRGYTISAYFWAENERVSGQSGIFWYDADGVLISSTSAAALVYVDSTWHYIECPAIAPANAAFARPFVTTQFSGTPYHVNVDDVTFTAGTSVVGALATTPTEETSQRVTIEGGNVRIGSGHREESSAGRLYGTFASYTPGSDDTDQLVAKLESPAANGNAQASLTLYGESKDGTKDTIALLTAALISLAGNTSVSGTLSATAIGDSTMAAGGLSPTGKNITSASMGAYLLYGASDYLSFSQFIGKNVMVLAWHSSQVSNAGAYTRQLARIRTSITLDASGGVYSHSPTPGFDINSGAGIAANTGSVVWAATGACTGEIRVVPECSFFFAPTPASAPDLSFSDASLIALVFAVP